MTLALLLILSAQALILAEQGRIERAVELYALTMEYPMVKDQQWFEDVTGQHILAVTATLLPEVVTTAQERGRARDLWETASELLNELSKEKE